MLKRLCVGLVLAAWPVLAGVPVVMISIDGLRPDSVTQADEHKLSIPALRRFIAGGTYADGVTGVLPTVTYPSHTTLVTGVEPARHGILANTAFDPDLHNMLGWYWYAEDVRVPTLWDAVSASGLAAASINWPVTVGRKTIRYNIPEYWRAEPNEDRKLLRALSTPGLLGDVEKVTGPFPVGSQAEAQDDAARALAAAWMLETYRLRFFTIHLNALDETEHAHGPFSAEANATLERLDAAVDRIVKAAQSADPATVVVVVSDHGFLRVDRHFNILIPFLDAKLIELEPVGDGLGGLPKVKRWDATVWPVGGAAAVVLARPSDSALAGRVRSLLAKLAADPANGIARILEKGEIAKRGGFPDASFLVEMRPGREIGLNTKGPLVTDAPATGTHGYLAERPEMRASLFILGAGIAAHHDLGVVDMRQIAPMVAALLGVTLPPAGLPALDVRLASVP
jgi:predicted AlkP superfamily pyrophosphatase or phosphodiesterase